MKICIEKNYIGFKYYFLYYYEVCCFFFWFEYILRVFGIEVFVDRVLVLNCVVKYKLYGCYLVVYVFKEVYVFFLEFWYSFYKKLIL